MKGWPGNGRRTAPLGLLLACAVGLGCQAADRSAGETADAPGNASGAVSADVSLYDLDLVFTNQNAEPLDMASLRGRPLVAAMMYTSCKSACPRIAADLRRLQDQLPAAGPSAPLFVMWSLDPTHDTPEALRAFARTNGLDSTRWQMLSGTEDGTLELAAVLDVRFREEESGEIAHSSLVFVIDQEGHIVHRQLSSEGDAPILEAVSALEKP